MFSKILWFVLLAGLFVLTQSFFPVKVALQERKTLLSHTNTIVPDKELKSKVKALRASVIKTILTSHNIPTRGVFEKSELEMLLVELEKSSHQKSVSALHTATLEEIPLGNGKTYAGLKLTYQGQEFRFIVDTGATINLIRSDIAKKLGLSGQAQSMYTHGLGGGGQVAASTCHMRSCSIGAMQFNLDFAILDNSMSIPQSAAGILGVNFLAALDVVSFDFRNKKFTCGPEFVVLSPLRRAAMCQINMQRKYAGLLTTEIYINNIQFPVTAMIDLGSTYSIANSKTVGICRPDLVTNSLVSMDSLPLTQVVCAGIDGKPLQLRSLALSQISLGIITLTQI